MNLEKKMKQAFNKFEPLKPSCYESGYCAAYFNYTAFMRPQ